MTKYVYRFGEGKAEGRADMRALLGGKGANLAEMSRIGLPVPPGFTISTEACTYFYQAGQSYPEGLKGDVSDALGFVESLVGAGFGDPENPLLVSVRSGARDSMPGMMDTVLNLGLNKATVAGLARRAREIMSESAPQGNDPLLSDPHLSDPHLLDPGRFAYDSFRRFIHMYGNVVLGVSHHAFEDTLADLKLQVGAVLDTELDSAQLEGLIASYLELVEQETGQPFPEDPQEQLWGAIGAVFKSWMTPRAQVYRRLHDIPEEWGTAVNIQAMVFGNRGSDCATGVAFTRDPATGENVFYGEYLINAQGEDVVAGIRTPQQLTIAGKEAHGSDLPAMEESMPSVFEELLRVRSILEAHYKDMQDIEFTVQGGKLYMLQTRNGKRSSQAAIQIACDLVDEGMIDKDEAVLRIAPRSLDQLLHPRLDPSIKQDALAKGLPASPGAAAGIIVLNADEAERLAAAGSKVLLVRAETSPEDIHGMHAAEGILTARGGMTSHAAVVARGMGRPCVVGVGALRIDPKNNSVQIGATTLAAGDWITIDGSSGDIFAGRIATVKPELSGNFSRLMGWADQRRRLKIRVNADTPDDCRTARSFGAEGIGLCRTEHMFFDAERILAVREMILADDTEGRRQALDRLLPMQRNDFIEIFKAMEGLPVTVRLLDPPLHEFLPREESEFLDLARSSGKSVEEVRQRAHALHEANPMLGHRGCRLMISYPEICEMQARAIIEAALEVAKTAAKDQQPSIEIMIPLVGMAGELRQLSGVVKGVAKQVMAEQKRDISYLIGTMIELPRAALQASEIAEEAEFFSFGTNDLTQTVFGLSRDDSGAFLGDYQRAGLLEHDPFQTLDQAGVGELVKMAVERGRITRPDIKLGICGEHGGDPASVTFFDQAGLDYVSCSPFRVPVARLAAAQASIKEQAAKKQNTEQGKSKAA